ncbi:MAG: proteasome accessory factor PafA2 family protein [Longimicrobiales bacterium]
MTRRRTLMGVETEYAVSGVARKGDLEPANLFTDLIADVKQRHAHVADSYNGLYLGNGARFYLDCASHPEYATPECPAPREVLAHIRAGERIVATAASAAHARHRDLTEVNVFRSNVDYRNGTTWGCHESYLHRTDPTTLPPMLIPHLVSRLIFTGAGGFNPRSPGLEFTLSPRAWMLECAISGNSTSTRGIFHTKNETLSSDGYHRLHLLCGESLCSDLSILLKLGTTALIVACIDAGWRVGEGLELKDPVAAMRAFAADPGCRVRVPLLSGQLISAITLQHQYLQRVEECRAQNLLPEWADEICQMWAATLDALEHNPRWAERRLDWSIKRCLYEHWAGGPVEWTALSRWSRIWVRINARFERALKGLPAPITRPALDTLLGEESPVPQDVAFLTRFLSTIGRDWNGVRQFLQRRQEMFEIDLRFGQLGERGIHTQLLAQGGLRPALVDDAEIERALTQPPSSGRASVRGALVTQAHASGNGAAYACDWTRILNRMDNRWVDLRDPFDPVVQWQPADHASVRQAVRHTLDIFF